MTEPRVYLQHLVDQAFISEKTKLQAESIIDKIQIIQQIAPGPDGHVGFNWFIDKQYYHLSIFADGGIEFYHEDITTEDYEESEDTFGSDTYDESIQKFVNKLNGLEG